MSDLQTATDIVAIVFMGVMLLTLVAVGIAALVIKSKINRAKTNIKHRIDLVTSLPIILKEAFRAGKKATGR